MTPFFQGVGFLVVTAALAIPIYFGLYDPSVRDFKTPRAITGFWVPVLVIAILWLVSAYMIFLQS